MTGKDRLFAARSTDWRSHEGMAKRESTMRNPKRDWNKLATAYIRKVENQEWSIS
jgi:hypothetical protein